MMSKVRILLVVSLLAGCGGDITEPDPDPCDQTVALDSETAVTVRAGQTICVVFEFERIAELPE